MNRLPRLLQSLVIVILLVSVVALAFVAYTQHQSQQYWHSQYEEIIRQNQNWQMPWGVP